MKTIKLGQILSINKGKKHTQIDAPKKNSVRLITIEDLRNDVTLKYTNDNNGISVNGNDLIITWDGANAGTIGFGKTGYIGSTLSRLRFHNLNEYYPPFIGKYLQSKFQYLRKMATGATIPHINRKALESIKLPVLSINEQISIATLLSRVERLIAQRKESLSLLNELVKSKFLEMFGDPVRNPKRWEKKKLEEFIIFLTSGSRGWAKYYSKEDGTLFLRIQNIGDAKLILDDTIRVKAPQNTEFKRTTVQPDDLLLSITADLGRTAVIPAQFEQANINQHIALIRLSPKINPVYVAHFIKMPKGRSQIL